MNLFFNSMQRETNREHLLHQKVNSYFHLFWLLAGNYHFILVPHTQNTACIHYYFFSKISSLDPAEEYKMCNKRRGLALIFNQERFFWRLGLNDRVGTSVDRYNLKKRYNFQLSAEERETLYLTQLCAKEQASTCLAAVAPFCGKTVWEFPQIFPDNEMLFSLLDPLGADFTFVLQLVPKPIFDVLYFSQIPTVENNVDPVVKRWF